MFLGMSMTATSNEVEFKRQFAAFLVQGFVPFVAALKMWPNNNGYAASIAAKWQTDPEVLNFMVEAKEAGSGKKGPSKVDLAAQLYERAQQMEDKEYVVAMRLLAEMSGFMPKAGDGLSMTNNIINQRVMVVQDKGTDEEWERKLADSQQKLIEHAS